MFLISAFAFEVSRYLFKPLLVAFRWGLEFVGRVTSEVYFCLYGFTYSTLLAPSSGRILKPV